MIVHCHKHEFNKNNPQFQGFSIFSVTSTQKALWLLNAAYYFSILLIKHSIGTYNFLFFPSSTALLSISWVDSFCSKSLSAELRSDDNNKFKMEICLAYWKTHFFVLNSLNLHIFIIFMLLYALNVIFFVYILQFSWSWFTFGV